MTQTQFNERIVEIANKIAAIWEYSYGRQGFKYDPRNPERFINRYEREHVALLQTEMKRITIDFTETK